MTDQLQWKNAAGVAILIAAEKLLPHPEFIARPAGITAVIAGVITTVQKLNQ